MSRESTKHFSNLNKPFKCEECEKKLDLNYFSPSNEGALCIYDCPDCGISYKVNYVN